MLADLQEAVKSRPRSLQIWASTAGIHLCGGIPSQFDCLESFCACVLAARNLQCQMRGAGR